MITSPLSLYELDRDKVYVVITDQSISPEHLSMLHRELEERGMKSVIIFNGPGATVQELDRDKHYLLKTDCVVHPALMRHVTQHFRDRGIDVTFSDNKLSLEEAT